MIKNTFYIFAGRISNVVFLFLLTVVVSRHLGPALFGIFSFLTTVVIAANCFSNLGLDTWMVREITQKPSQAKKILSNILGLKFAASLVTILFVFLIFQSSNLPDSTLHLLWILSISLLFNTVSQTLWHYGNCFKQFIYHSVLWASSNALKATLGIILVLLYGNLEPLIWGVVIAEAVAMFLSFYIIYQKFGHFSPEFHFLTWKDFLFRSSPIAMGMIFSVLYFRLDVVMLQLMTEETVVGWYSAAYKFFEGAVILPHSLMLVMFPTLVDEYHKDFPRFKNSVLKALTMFSLIGALIALVLWGFSSQIILLIYGNDFSPAIGILDIIAIAVFLFFINFLLSNILITSGREVINTWNLVIATFLNIMLNLTLIPLYGGLGAAWATLICEIFLIVILSLEVRKFIKGREV